VVRVGGSGGGDALQCVAMCYSVLQCGVAVCVVGGSGGGDVLPCVVAVCCCSVCCGLIGWWRCVAVCCCSVLLQCVLGVDRVVEHPIVAVCVVGSDNSKVALLPRVREGGSGGGDV